jgi:phospholipid/cholesterol/gamma-HCH transport system permease protein
VYRVAGALTITRAATTQREIAALPDPLTIDLSEIDRMDTVGAWLIYRAVRDRGAKVTGASEDVAGLLEQVKQADKPVRVIPEEEGGGFKRTVAELGEYVIEAGQILYGLLNFFGATLLGFWNVFKRPQTRFRLNAVVQRFDLVGVRALGIIGLMSFLIGVVIGQQGAVQLRQFGAEIYTINLIGRITVRELGTLMTAIMVAGRSGSAFAAQLGTMKLTEEIDAMRTIGVSPVEALVIPRMMASIIMMPLLAFYAMIMAILGGGIFCWISLGIPPLTFVQRLQEVVPVTDLWVGLIKAPVFGFVIALVGCFQGMLVEGDAEQVGLRTTAAVVQAIFLVIVIDAIFAVFFTSVGWG